MRLLHYPVPVRFHAMAAELLKTAAMYRRFGCHLLPLRILKRARRNRLMAQMNGWRLP